MTSIPNYIGWPVVAALAYAIFAFLANRSVYYPLKHPKGWWEVQRQLGAEDIWLETNDGVRIHAWWLRAEPEQRVTLFLHGNAGNLTFRAHHAREIVAAGSSLLLVDYRGYGRSQGWPTEKGLYADADAGYRYLLERGYLPEQIILHGESLGTAVAVDLAARVACGGIILEAPFSSARNVARRLLPVIGPAVIFGFDSLAKIGRVKAPVLIVHGDRDEIIAHELGRELFAAAPNPKQFWTVPGAGHNDILAAAGPEYGARLRGFYGGAGGR